MFWQLNILAFVVGTSLLQQQADLPAADKAGWLLPVLLLLALLWRSQSKIGIAVVRALIWILIGIAGFFWAATVAHWRLSDHLPESWERRDIQVIGVIASVPSPNELGTRFYLDIEKIITEEAVVPQRVALTWYKESLQANRQAEHPVPQAGERWQLTVRLKRPHGNANPHGFDYEVWALERNIRAMGYVRKSDENHRLDKLVFKPRYLIEKVRETIQQNQIHYLADRPYAGILSTLATGDQYRIPREQWQVLIRTGTSHLMAISGLHITMVSSLIFGLVYWLWRWNSYLTLRIPARRAAVLAGLIAAFGYALISGFAIPAQRAFCMLTVIAIAIWRGRQNSASGILAWALFWVVLLDPWATISPGFWLSFGAVAIIMLVTVGRLGKFHWLQGWLRIQWAITLGLIPVLLALFQQISLVSPIANAIAIPLISLAVVPLTLVAIILPFEFLLHVAHSALVVVMSFLNFLSEFPQAVWLQHSPPFWTIVTGFIGVLWILLPGGIGGLGWLRGFPARWLGFLAMLPMFLVQLPKPKAGELWLTVLDVGQGLAVVARTEQHALLFDTGPKLGETDSGRRIIVPFLYSEGIRRLDVLMVSHADSDHSGGALSVLAGIPVEKVYSSLDPDHPIRQSASSNLLCHVPQTWQWDGVQFEVLHPLKKDYLTLKGRNNKNNCVLKITTAHGSVLLPADIESIDEQAILARSPDNLAATALIAPHHGSMTSSTDAFVKSVNPVVTVFTVGYLNRYGHPNNAVTQRYRHLGSKLMRSDRDGAVILRFADQQLVIDSWRNLYRRYWHQRFPEYDKPDM
ncbi:DNA internalization-related competence protein ComEC/Rec2 [Nitrosomonas sp. wSCUT-2]